MAMRQIGLLPAGCQPWNPNMIAAHGHQFAYCASLAVYFYEYDHSLGEYKLSSISSFHDKTITCITWSKQHQNLYATAGADNVINVCDVSTNKVIYKKTGVADVKCIDWIPGSENDSTLAYCRATGPVYLWDMKKDKVVEFHDTTKFEFSICLFRWHHTDPSKFVIGHVDGSLSFYQAGKSKKHSLTADENTMTRDPVRALLWDPLSSDYLLVSRKITGIQLVDSKSRLIITQFKFPSKMITSNTLSWIDSAPGMFLTGDVESGVIRMWAVSNSTPLKSINVKSTGFQCLLVLASVAAPTRKAGPHIVVGGDGRRERKRQLSHQGAGGTAAASSLTVPPARVFAAFSDGGVGLYNLQTNQWEMLKEQSHIETIFDCKFKPDNPEQLATASFDGTIKIWSTTDLSVIESSRGNEGVIYSIAWAPDDIKQIVAGTRRNGVFVWDITSLKIVHRYKEHGANPVFCVAWTKHNNQHRIASCGDDSNCFVRQLDGTLLKQYTHPGKTFGCAWNELNNDLLATGCADGIVRVFKLSSNLSKPCMKFERHASRVFHVRWHPTIKYLLCSGSDDRMIKIWNIEKKVCQMTLEGHTSCVRGLTWNYEIPHLLASGSWDSTIRLWDVRDGKCLEIIRDHGADVYGLTTHPQTPFSYATSSRDSTVRIWSLTLLVQDLLAKVLIKEPLESLVGQSDEIMKKGEDSKLCGSMSLEIKNRLLENHHDFFAIRWFSELCYSTVRIEGFWDIVGYMRGQPASSLSSGYSKGIVHVDHLLRYKAAEMRSNELTSSRKKMVKGREKLLQTLADQQWKLGEMEKYCDSLVALNQWEKAIAIAPCVSVNYWSKLLTQYAQKLAINCDESSLPYFVAAGQSEEAVNLLLTLQKPQDALIVAQGACEGNLPGPAGDGNKSVKPTYKYPRGNYLVNKCVTEEANRLFDKGQIYEAACFHLAGNDISSALHVLFNSNELVLLLYCAQTVKYRSDMVTRAAHTFAKQCSRTSRAELGMKILQKYDMGSGWTTAHEICSNIKDETEKARLHQLIGLPAPTEAAHEAHKLAQSDDGDKLEIIRLHFIGSNPADGLSLCIKQLEDKLSTDKWKVSEFDNEFKVLLDVPSHVLQENKEERCKVVGTSAYIGAIKASMWGYTKLVKPLLQCAASLFKLLSGDAKSHFPLTEKRMNEHVIRFNQDPQLFYEAVLERGRDLLEEEYMKHNIQTLGGTLPSHSDTRISTLTGNRISGSHCLMEDERTVMSLNEAIMWSRCTPYSPTCSGHRIHPF